MNLLVEFLLIEFGHPYKGWFFVNFKEGVRIYR